MAPVYNQNQYGGMSNLGALPAYSPPVQSYVMPAAPQQVSFGDRRKGITAPASNYTSLAASAAQAQAAAAQRAQQQQTAVISGYDQQIANSRMLGDQGYQTAATNYDAVAADAAATRERNMGRIDQYGASMRQDLDIKNRQAMAAAGQSAIKRGLGNTTIYDSLQRGQQFDNTRQQLSLEDQLLQNKISTDSNLSNSYQTALQNRAQGLASQWNANMNNENQLTGQRLNYIGNIQDNSLDWFRTSADLYGQQLQMDNANQQAALNRAQQSAMSQSQQSSYVPIVTNPQSLSWNPQPRPSTPAFTYNR